MAYGKKRKPKTIELCNDGEYHPIVREIRRVKCGKFGCKVCAGECGGHGPYVYNRYNVKGRVRRDYVGRVGEV